MKFYSLWLQKGTTKLKTIQKPMCEITSRGNRDKGARGPEHRQGYRCVRRKIVAHTEGWEQRFGVLDIGVSLHQMFVIRQNYFFNLKISFRWFGVLIFFLSGCNVSFMSGCFRDKQTKVRRDGSLRDKVRPTVGRWGDGWQVFLSNISESSLRQPNDKIPRQGLGQFTKHAKKNENELIN